MALCSHLQGQQGAGAGDLHVWLAEAGQSWELSHQLLLKFQDQVHDLHLRFVLHPGLNVLLGTRQGHPLPRPSLSPGPLPLLQPSPPYRLTDGLKVQGFQFMGHLSVLLPVPAIKMGGLEKPPVGSKGQQLWS